eukprot:2788102-Rhodomonas_salina.1
MTALTGITPATSLLAYYALTGTGLCYYTTSLTGTDLRGTGLHSPTRAAATDPVHHATALKLSSNEIVKMQGLEALLSLKVLDLSYVLCAILRSDTRRVAQAMCCPETAPAFYPKVGRESS